MQLQREASCNVIIVYRTLQAALRVGACLEQQSRALLEARHRSGLELGPFACLEVERQPARPSSLTGPAFSCQFLQ